MSLSSLKRGFTLIELLLVIGIIAILAAIVIVAINPTKQLGDARNAQRRADVNTIINAVYQYAIDNDAIPTVITTSESNICRTALGGCSALSAGAIDLDMLTGAYIVSLPVDPQESSGAITGYRIYKAGAGNNVRVTVTAPHAEQGETISVSR